MKRTTPHQPIVDVFVKSIGGEVISDLVGNNNPPSHADYLFRCPNVIAELKALQADSFGDPFCRKMGGRMGDWHRDGRLLVCGTARIDSNRLAPECQDDMFDLMAGPLQKQVVSAADSQIESTKQILNVPDAKGLLWVASDGNEDLQPGAVWFLLKLILQKKHENGERSVLEHSCSGILQPPDAGPSAGVQTTGAVLVQRRPPARRSGNVRFLKVAL